MSQGLLLFHTRRQFNQGILRHWREITVDFDEEGFFAAELNYVIVKVEKVREGNAEGATDKAEGMGICDFYVPIFIQITRIWTK